MDKKNSFFTDNAVNCQFSDFQVFNDLHKFEHFINLKDATVLDCINSYITNRSKNKKNTTRQYSSVIKHIQMLEKTFRIKLFPVVIGDMFWNQFHAYLREKHGLADTTINNICSKICAVLKWSSKYGAVISPTLDECYTTTNAARPTISLTLDEVSRITYFDIKGALDDESRNNNQKFKRTNYIRTLEKVRDEFVIQCFIGQRYSDASRFTQDNFKNDVFSIVQQKTGNKAVVDFKKMCLYPEVVRTILEKYNYRSPFSGDISNYNKKIHELFKLAGFDDEIIYEYKENGVMHKKTFKKYELITSHTARRTMISNNVQRGLSFEEIRRASGHKSETAFGRYVIWNND